MDSEFSSGGEGEDSGTMAEITDPATQVDYIFNILLIGDSGVGKTDLIGRLCDEGFKTKFFATIGKGQGSGHNIFNLSQIIKYI